MKIKKMHIENFMYVHNADVEFANKTLISGMNGSGKSTNGHAIHWLLLNCDMDLRDNPVVRREVDGEPVNDMDVIVEAVIEQDGVDNIYKKVQKRTFSKDGKSFKDDNKYFVNEVPMTLKAFNEKLNIDLDVFKHCLSLKSFTSMKPKEMREEIFSMVSSESDLDICKKAQISVLADKLDKYTTEELRALNTSIKTKSSKELPLLDGQLMEAERLATLVIDTKDLEFKKESIEKEISLLRFSEQEFMEKKDEIDRKCEALMEMKFKAQEMEANANNGIREQHNNAFESYVEERHKTEKLRNMITQMESDIEWNKREISSINKHIEDAREQYRSYKKTSCPIKQKDIDNIKNSVFDEKSGYCTMCGQKLPEDKIKELKKSFESAKKKRVKELEKQVNDFEKKKEKALSELESKGKAYKEDLKSTQKHYSGLIKKLENAKVALQAQLEMEAKAKELYDKLPSKVDMSNNEEYQKLLTNIENLKAEIDASKAEDIAETRTRIKFLEQELVTVNAEIAKADRTEFKNRVIELNDKKRSLAQSKANAEQILDALDELDKAKNEYLTEQINSHFSLVKWRMFEFAKNGNYKNVCIPMVDGKEILTIKANKALRLNGLIDICSSIQKYHGIDVPIIIDDFEAFDDVNATSVINTDRQVICMKVSNDNLTIRNMEE